MKKFRYNIVLILAILILLCFVIGIRGNLAGSDDAARKAIIEQSSGYRPWFNYLWTPSSNLAEGMLFAGQGIAGLAFIAYYIRKKKKCSK